MERGQDLRHDSVTGCLLSKDALVLDLSNLHPPTHYLS